MGVKASVIVSQEQPTTGRKKRIYLKGCASLAAPGLAADFLQHCLHFRLRMRIPLARGRPNSVLQHFLGLVDAIRLDQCLRRHEIPGSILWIGGKQGAEFAKRLIRLPGFGVFHRQSISGKGIVWILRENCLETFLASHQFIALVKENSCFEPTPGEPYSAQSRPFPEPLQYFTMAQFLDGPAKIPLS